MPWPGSSPRRGKCEGSSRAVATQNNHIINQKKKEIKYCCSCFNVTTNCTKRGVTVRDSQCSQAGTMDHTSTTEMSKSGAVERQVLEKVGHGSLFPFRSSSSTQRPNLPFLKKEEEVRKERVRSRLMAEVR